MSYPIIIASIVLSGICSAFAQPSVIDKTIAVVGDKVVLLSDVEMNYHQYLSQGAKPSEALRCQVLAQLLQEKLLLYQADLDSVTVSDEEVEGEMERKIRYFISLIGSKEKLEDYYKKSIPEIKEEFREDVRSQLLSEKMQNTVLKNVKVTPSEVKAFFKDIPADSLPYFNAGVEVGQIIAFPKTSKLQDDLAKEKIAGLRERVLKGEDFATLALLYSEDPGSAQNGGDLGFMSRDELVTEFAEAAFRLKQGEVSGTVKTKFGYHILQLVERRGDKIRVRHILVKPAVAGEDLLRARNLLDSVRTLILADSLTFGEAAERYSDDEKTKHNGGLLINPSTSAAFFETGQLDPAVYFVIEKMKPGGVSTVQPYTEPGGRQGYRMLYLKTETKPHAANLKDDYDKIQAAALSARQASRMEEWVREKMKRTYVHVDPAFKQCPEIEAWAGNGM